MINSAAQDVAEALRAAGSPVRIEVLRRLARGAATVSELVADLGISQPLTSHHLGVLRSAGLVTASRSGRVVTYRIADGPLARSLAELVRQQVAD
ncbi:ArsR/SmtB family transcription factor [Actinokineospora bangkokensis]|uniref:HTH arsR-type domain-containing protein n=1 Tax=Actinokineospora bangkokensis TaxID=1193682 RepID=A0A1Q9LMI7_9PSEU|nr:metalloregulator ArsR/SmtB family transcription factor [Actinokineospora bangkokensis]OLR93257.1 hypothetical protein BJP25_17385 [Actinokineospora bangkokensis]